MKRNRRAAGPTAADLSAAVHGGRSPLWGLNEGVPPALRGDPAIDARDDTGRTPLLYAAATGRAAAFHGLLTRGAAMDAVDTHGRNLLHHAGRHGRIMDAALATMPATMRAGMLHARDAFGYRPLDMALIREEEAEMSAIIALMAAGAPMPDMDIAASVGREMVDCALMAHHDAADIIRRGLSGAPVGIRTAMDRLATSASIMILAGVHPSVHVRDVPIPDDAIRTTARDDHAWLAAGVADHIARHGASARWVMSVLAALGAADG